MTIAKPGRHGDGDGLYLNAAPSGTNSWVQRIVINEKQEAKESARYRPDNPACRVLLKVLPWVKRPEKHHAACPAARFLGRCRWCGNQLPTP